MISVSYYSRFHHLCFSISIQVTAFEPCENVNVSDMIKAENQVMSQNESNLSPCVFTCTSHSECTHHWHTGLQTTRDTQRVLSQASPAIATIPAMTRPLVSERHQRWAMVLPSLGWLTRWSRYTKALHPGSNPSYWVAMSCCTWRTSVEMVRVVAWASLNILQFMSIQLCTSSSRYSSVW